MFTNLWNRVSISVKQSCKIGENFGRIVTKINDQRCNTHTNERTLICFYTNDNKNKYEYVGTYSNYVHLGVG